MEWDDLYLNERAKGRGGDNCSGKAAVMAVKEVREEGKGKGEGKEFGDLRQGKENVI